METSSQTWTLNDCWRSMAKKSIFGWEGCLEWNSGDRPSSRRRASEYLNLNLKAHLYLRCELEAKVNEGNVYHSWAISDRHLAIEFPPSTEGDLLYAAFVRIFQAGRADYPSWGKSQGWPTFWIQNRRANPKPTPNLKRKPCGSYFALCKCRKVPNCLIRVTLCHASVIRNFANFRSCECLYQSESFLA